MYIVSIFHEGCPSMVLAAEPLNPDKKCPTCQAKVDSNDPKFTINRLVSQITGTVTACAIVIKPSNGHFKNFKIGDDLHIGITNSQGAVHSFWSKGIEIQTTTWQDSVPLLDLQPFFFGNVGNVDNCIEFFVETQKMSQKFHKSKYRETTWNCFDFVLEFLKFINFRNYSKLDFSKEFTAKKLQNVVKYCTLYEKLLREN